MGHKFGLRREGGARRREVWEHLQIKLWAAEEEFHVSALAQTFFFLTVPLDSGVRYCDSCDRK